MMGTNFTSDENGCYIFNFDDLEKGNAKALQLKNKEKITGTIKYYDGKFSDNSLKFDDNSIIKDDTNTKTFDSNYATLIYYNNVSSGQPANKVYSYDSSGENWHGPRMAIAQLPTSSQWSNVCLKNSTRTIVNENGGNITTGGTLPSNYSYIGYSARFLTFQ